MPQYVGILTIFGNNSGMLTKFLGAWFEQPVRPRVIVVGNRKGGSGKSTAAIHLVSGLLNYGYSVGAVDLEVRASLANQLQSRANLARLRVIDRPEVRKRNHGNARRDAEKAKRPLAAILRYLTLLIDEILEAVPPGTTPPTEMVTLRSQEDMEPYLREPLSEGWKTVYGLPKIGQQ